jgi:hypothetical protein
MAAVALANSEGHFVGNGVARHSARDRKRRYRKGHNSNENGSDEGHGFTGIIPQEQVRSSDGIVFRR